MLFRDALIIAEEVKELLAPYCERIEIAGSIRRKKPEAKDIEIICIPKPYETGLFQSGVALIAGQWKKIKGEFPCRYTQRMLQGQTLLNAFMAVGRKVEGRSLKAMSILHGSPIKLDLFLVRADQWGLQLAIRTGCAEYSHKVLATTWHNKGYHSEEGYLYYGAKQLEIREEKDLFDLLNLEYVEPERRNLSV